MKLFEKVRSSVKKKLTRAQKDNVLVTAIHHIMVDDIMDEIFDVDAGEIKYHLVLDMDEFVDDGLNLINEDELVRIVSDYSQRLYS
ncbi:MAG: hypothetical protein H0M93_04425 [Methanophagales archaeon]|nr:hypothetical protein [Methanophagales archaeon]